MMNKNKQQTPFVRTKPIRKDRSHIDLGRLCDMPASVQARFINYKITDAMIDAGIDAISPYYWDDGYMGISGLRGAIKDVLNAGLSVHYSYVKVANDGVEYKIAEDGPDEPS